MIGYVEDILYYIARHFIQTGRGHEAFKDQRFWTDMFLALVPDLATRGSPAMWHWHMCTACSALDGEARCRSYLRSS